MMRRLIDAVADDPNQGWGESTRETFRSDANAILESLLLTYGIEAAAEALVKQGYSPTGQYMYALKPLHEKALERRAERFGKSDSPS